MGEVVDDLLRTRLRQLNINKPLDEQRGNQIGRLRKRLRMRQMREPLEIVLRTEQPEKSMDVFAKTGRSVCFTPETGSVVLAGEFSLHHDP